MKKLSVFLCVISIVFMISCSGNTEDNENIGDVNTYPWPDGMVKYEGVTMSANDKDIDLYSVRANNTHSWSTQAQNRCDRIPVGMFDMEEGLVYISITVPVKPANVIIRPVSLNITPRLYEGKITFTINKPGQYSVEYNGDVKNTVLIFANPIEDFSVIEASARTITYEEGITPIGTAGNEKLNVPAGSTLYLKPGAVIRGAVVLNSNSKIVGRGIIDGSHLDDWVLISNRATLPIETYGATNVEINGITIFDPNAWTVQLQNTRNVTIDNLKVISSRCNSDGISIQSSDTITIQNSFLRTWDDSVVIKNYGNRDSYDITVKNCIFWTDLAQTMEIGVETNKGRKSNPKIYNINFEDILIFHALHKAPISIHNGDNAEIYDVTFKNITIEDYNAGLGDGWNYLIDITNLTGGGAGGMGGSSSWTTVQERGNIHDVLIENVRILSGKDPLTAGKNPGARFDSNQGGRIYDVTVKNIYYQNTKLDLSGETRVKANAEITFP